MPPSPKSIEERFWPKVLKTEGCWLWMGGRFPRGYGQFHPSRRLRYAHRVAWLLTRGEIPVGLQVLHRCDNPRCVNPQHLFLGTARDNMHDMRKKGRQNDPQGECNGGAKLTEESVRDARKAYAAGESLAAIARRCGVRFQTIQAIVVERRTWKHVA